MRLRQSYPRATLLLKLAVAASISGCGLRTPGGIVLGTTGFLAEHNAATQGAPMDAHTPLEKAKLQDLIRRY